MLVHNIALCVLSGLIGDGITAFKNYSIIYIECVIAQTRSSSKFFVTILLIVQKGDTYWSLLVWVLDELKYLSPPWLNHPTLSMHVLRILNEKELLLLVSIKRKRDEYDNVANTGKSSRLFGSTWRISSSYKSYRNRVCCF